jgi:hypothetical protein
MLPPNVVGLATMNNNIEKDPCACYHNVMVKLVHVTMNLKLEAWNDAFIMNFSWHNDMDYMGCIEGNIGKLFVEYIDELNSYLYGDMNFYNKLLHV